MTSVVYRQGEDPESVQSGVDGSVEHRRMYEIECRGRTAGAAEMMADDILREVGDRALLLVTRYDQADDDTQKELGYFAHVLEVVFPVDGLPDE